MKQLTEETQKSLEAIRDKVTNKGKHPATSYSPQEVLHLQEVNREILSWSNIRQNTINQSCTSCIQEAINIAYNYVTYHEIRPDNRKAKVIEVTTGEPQKPVVEWGSDNKYPEAAANMQPAPMPNAKGGHVLVQPMTIDEIKKLSYPALMNMAKLHGHTGKREKAEKLIAFIEGKMKG